MSGIRTIVSGFIAFAICTATLSHAEQIKIENTYCVGATYTPFSKSYSYCRKLTVEMIEGTDGSIKFIYTVRNDSGELMDEEAGKITLNSSEIEPFARVFLQAWEIYTREEKVPPGASAELESFRGKSATYVCDVFGVHRLGIKYAGTTEDNSAFMTVSGEGVCATLSLLSRTAAGKKLLGNGERFREGMKKTPISVPFTEKEEIDLSGAIVRKFNASSWGTWKGWVVYERLDFRRLTAAERQYLAKIFPRRSSPAEAPLRTNSSVDFMVRLKLSDPETLRDLSEAFRVGHFDAADAAACCGRAANVDLLPIAAKYLFTDEAPRVVEMSDVWTDPRPSFHSAAAIGALLAACPEFPEPVRKAAKTWAHNPLGSQSVEVFRKWWRENQQRIAKRAYHEVTPPALYTPL